MATAPKVPASLIFVIWITVQATDFWSRPDVPERLSSGDVCSAQARQMQERSRASGGMRSRTSDGISVVKHQQVLAPAAIPQSFGPPHNGQRRGSTPD
jgi:hypothetical protein